MSTASHTTQGSQSLRPAAIAAVFVAAAVLGALVGFAASRAATSQQAPHEVVVGGPAVASIPGDMSSGAYAALHPAPAAVAPGAPNRVVGLSEATGLEHANGGNGTGATGSAGVGEATGIPYEGTGRAADLIRASSVAAVRDTGIPYEGTGPAALIIRGGYSGGTEGPVVAPAAVASTGIPYEGTGRAADLIRASLATP